MSSRHTYSESYRNIYSVALNDSMFRYDYPEDSRSNKDVSTIWTTLLIWNLFGSICHEQPAIMSDEKIASVYAQRMLEACASGRDSGLLAPGMVEAWCDLGGDIHESIADDFVTYADKLHNFRDISSIGIVAALETCFSVYQDKEVTTVIPAIVRTRRGLVGIIPTIEPDIESKIYPTLPLRQDSHIRQLPLTRVDIWDVHDERLIKIGRGDIDSAEAEADTTLTP